MTCRRYFSLGLKFDLRILRTSLKILLTYLNLSVSSLFNEPLSFLLVNHHTKEYGVVCPLKSVHVPYYSSSSLEDKKYGTSMSEIRSKRRLGQPSTVPVNGWVSLVTRKSVSRHRCKGENYEARSDLPTYLGNSQSCDTLDQDRSQRRGRQ